MKYIWTYLVYNYICLYRLFINGVGARVGSMEEVKKNKKVLYYFAIFTIVNELLITENHRMSPAYWKMQVRDEMQPPSR